MSERCPKYPCDELEACDCRGAGRDKTPGNDGLRITTLEEAAQELIDGGRVPAMLDAAENVIIAHSMGWDMEGVIEALRQAIDL